ncbi:hypothetical protein [Caldimonas sp. KR1-144]|uniref:hypothetical protein n=1 Tax=Caldimonas sp. KR1-144 TaxID=3400911 RepID=UPI003C119869
MSRFTHSLMALALGAAFAGGLQAQTVGTGDHKAAKDQIEASYKAAREACDQQSGNAKDVCVEQAKGQRKVEEAQLEYRRSGRPADQQKIAIARAEADYAVAKERCDDLSGNAKDVCVKDAKAAETRAKADAKMAMANTENRQDAASDKRKAEYKAAVERCDSLAGDAKDSCVAAAKQRYDKR